MIRWFAIGKVKFRIPAFFQRGYTFPALIQLFLVCVFPTHLWALLLSFRDVTWVAERTRAWDAVSLVAYALLFSLLETIVIFFVLLLLDLLLPRLWPIQQRVIFIGTMFLILAVWGVISQLYFISAEPPIPTAAIGFLVRAGHPWRIVWAVLLPVVVLSFAWPAYWVIRSQKTRAAIKSFFDRLTVLSSVYLFLDVIGIVIVAIRNI